MNLAEYMFYKNLKTVQVAEILDIEPSYAAKIIHGKRNVSRKVGKKVEAFTGGVVKSDYIAGPPTHPLYEKIK